MIKQYTQYIACVPIASLQLYFNMCVYIELQICVFVLLYKVVVRFVEFIAMCFVGHVLYFLPGQ